MFIVIQLNFLKHSADPQLIRKHLSLAWYSTFFLGFPYFCNVYKSRAVRFFHRKTSEFCIEKHPPGTVYRRELFRVLGCICTVVAEVNGMYKERSLDRIPKHWHLYLMLQSQEQGILSPGCLMEYNLKRE